MAIAAYAAWYDASVRADATEALEANLSGPARWLHCIWCSWTLYAPLPIFGSRPLAG